MHFIPSQTSSGVSSLTSIRGLVFALAACIALPHRARAAGEVDLSFGIAEYSFITTLAIAPQPDGQIMIGGVSGYGRLNASDGQRDGSFYDFSQTSSVFEGAAVQADGKVLFIGRFPQDFGGARHGVVRLNADGGLGRVHEL